MFEDDLDEDEDMSLEDSPESKQIHNSGSKNNQDENRGIEKWEKNVKRRVYDALNVLYAAGVLRKEGKLVSCDPRDLHMRINSKAGYESQVDDEEEIIP
jgi:hypothetical protein